MEIIGACGGMEFCSSGEVGNTFKEGAADVSGVD